MLKPYYETKNGKLYNGDCVDIVREINTTTFLLTDPPYGIGADKGFTGAAPSRKAGRLIPRKQYVGSWDFERPSVECFNLLLKQTKNAIIFGGNFFADILPATTHWIVWDKKNTMPTFGDAELIWTNIKRKSVKIFICEWNGLLGREGKRVHPSQKPVRLLIDLIEKYTKEDDVILDPFFGSGGTGIACERLGRRWIGVEKEKDYCEIATKRIITELSQYRLPGF